MYKHNSKLINRSICILIYRIARSVRECVRLLGLLQMLANYHW